MQCKAQDGQNKIKMVKEVKMYTVICDNCGKDSNSGSEYSCWSEESHAKDVAMDSDWINHERKDLCPDCWHYDDEDNIIIHKVEKDSKCKKHGVVFDYINGNPVCPICEG